MSEEKIDWKTYDQRDVKFAFILFRKDQLAFLMSLNPSREEFHALVQEELEKAPDDTGNSWKHPYLWTPEEIHNLVMDEVGIDESSARGYQILVKLWTPPEEINGIVQIEQKRRDLMQTTCLGKILRMGKECFTDKARFPYGPRVTYGEWGLFRNTEKQKIEKNGVMLATLYDDRFILVEKNPVTLETSFSISADWAGH
jgi:hypothetical protein